jgi:hypothetical protein
VCACGFRYICIFKEEGRECGEFVTKSHTQDETFRAVCVFVLVSEAMEDCVL